MTVRFVATEAFAHEVLESERPTLVDFYADWCGPCRAMAPVVDELARDLDGRANVVKVNVDESPDLASEYAVQSIPTFLVMRGGDATQRLVGMQTKQALVKAAAG